jgi:hypothetical protein
MDIIQSAAAVQLAPITHSNGVRQVSVGGMPGRLRLRRARPRRGESLTRNSNNSEFTDCVFQSASANALPRGLEDEDFLSGLQNYVKESQLDVTIPEGMSILSGTHLTFSPRNIDEDELSLKVTLPSSGESVSVGEGISHFYRAEFQFQLALFLQITANYPQQTSKKVHTLLPFQFHHHSLRG